ncbi:MAG TPA: radical SAM protein [Eudoraea sp.]|nr:radical SAM protein [Eudoraea sp.]
MSLLLTHAYYLDQDPKEQRIMKPYPPLGLLYISAYLNEKGVENHVFDTTFSDQSRQLQFIEDKKPDVVAIYTNLMTKIEVVRLIRELRNNARYRFPIIVLGGPDITYNCEKYLKAGAHYLVIGEGERSMYELYRAIAQKLAVAKVHGIAFLEEGQVVRTSPRAKMKDLSKLPIPNREAVPMEKYLQTWKDNHGKSSITLSTQRGCPYTCKWCSTAVYGQSYRRRPASDVAEEMAMLKARYHPDALWFVDDVFTVSHKWIHSFHEEVIRKNARIPFECITRAERLNDEVLKLLKEAGCYRIWIGAESGSQRIVDAMDRRVDIDVVKEMIRKTNALGMESGTFIMLGYPGETTEDIRKTIAYLKDARPTHYTITIAYPIKGTALYHEVENLINVQPDWETSTDREIDFKRTYPKKFYKYAVSRVINDVNSSRADTAGQRFKLKLKSLVSLLLMKYHAFIPLKTN